MSSSAKKYKQSSLLHCGKKKKTNLKLKNLSSELYYKTTKWKKKTDFHFSLIFVSNIKNSYRKKGSKEKLKGNKWTNAKAPNCEETQMWTVPTVEKYTFKGSNTKEILNYIFKPRGLQDSFQGGAKFCKGLANNWVNTK